MLTKDQKGNEMKFSVKCLLLFVIFCAVGCSKEVQFGDPNLEAAIREAIDKPEGAITERDLKRIAKLDVPDKNIRDIEPLSGLTNVTLLILSGNQIADITPLSNLTTLIGLGLAGNGIGDDDLALLG